MLHGLNRCRKHEKEELTQKLIENLVNIVCKGFLEVMPSANVQLHSKRKQGSALTTEAE